MNRYGPSIISIIFILSILFFPVCPAMAGLVNGDFSQDPPGTGWSYSSSGVDVYSDSTAWDGNGLAVLYTYNESEATVSELSQDNVFLLPGETQMLFDIVMYKSQDTPETDTFRAIFGTQVYILRTSDFTGPVFSDTIVFDLSGLSAGPYTLTFQLENEYDCVETSVLIDNVQFSPVPVPGAFLLAAIGMFSAATSRKLRTQISE